MKRIEATVRPELLETVVAALGQTRASGVTVVTALGHGIQGGLTQKWRGADVRATLLPKVTLWTVVPDDEATDVAETIVASARTGTLGDGKVFVTDVSDAFRVRTGEHGERVVRGVL